MIEGCYFEVPSHVSIAEAASLYRFMATQQPSQTKFLDKRNQFIFDELNCYMKDAWGGRRYVGTHEFIMRLTESELLEKAGGIGYVQKVFNGLEPEEVYCENSY